MRDALGTVVLAAWAMGCAPIPKNGIPVAPLRAGPPLQSYEQSRPSMGGLLRIVVIAPDGRDDKVEHALGKAFDAADRWEKLLSEWIPDSPVSQINAAAGKEPVAVPDDVIAALEKSLAVSHASNGAFDVSFASMDPIWDFRPDVPHRVPTAEERAAARAHVDWTKIVVSRRDHTVFLPDPKMKISFGGIGQGIGADAAAAELRDAGFDDFVVDESGDEFFAGDGGGKSWKAAIQDPRGERGKTVATIALRDEALTTSGDYEKYFVGDDGIRYHHILDPRTGSPARGLASVTILAQDTTTADGYDTAILAAGPKDGLAVMQSRGLEGILIEAPEDNGGKRVMTVTAGLRKRIDLSAWDGQVVWADARQERGANP